MSTRPEFCVLQCLLSHINMLPLKRCKRSHCLEAVAGVPALPPAPHAPSQDPGCAEGVSWLRELSRWSGLRSGAGLQCPPRQEGPGSASKRAGGSCRAAPQRSPVSCPSPAKYRWSQGRCGKCREGHRRAQHVPVTQPASAVLGRLVGANQILPSFF